jgi:hypothetical protein
MGNRHHRCAGEAIAESLWRPVRSAHRDPARPVATTQQVDERIPTHVYANMMT